MKYIIVLLVGLVASLTSAEASWRSPVDGTKSGYCMSAYSGRPISQYWARDIRFCPENRKQKPKVKKVKTVSVEPYANLTLDEAQRQEFVPQVSVYETIDRVLSLPKGTTLQSLRMPPYDGTEAYAQVK